METPIEEIKKAGQESATFHWPTTKIQNSRFVADECQTFVLEQRATVLLDTEHPYRALQHMVGDVLVMLHSAASQSTKPRCIETIKTAANYIKRFHLIRRSLFRSGAADPQYPRTPVQLIRIKGYVRDVLKKAGERLTLNKSLTQYLSLHGIKEILKEPTELIAEAQQHVANFIAEDSIKGGIAKCVAPQLSQRTTVERMPTQLR